MAISFRRIAGGIIRWLTGSSKVFDVSGALHSGASDYIPMLWTDGSNQYHGQGGTYTVGGGGTVEINIPVDLGTVYIPVITEGTANHDYVSAINGATMEITGTASDTGWWAVFGY